LLNNRIIKGGNKDALNLVKMHWLFWEKLNNINSELLKLKKEYHVNIKKAADADRPLQNYNVNIGGVVKDATNYRIVVTVSADMPANWDHQFNFVNFKVTGWAPNPYDLRTKN